MSNSDYHNQAAVQPSFEIDPVYSHAYLDDNYEPEHYNTMKDILSGITKSFDDFLDEHEKYRYLKSIDIDKVGINDRIMIIEPCCTGIVMNIEDDNYLVNVGGDIIKTHKRNIKPVDEYINKLKIADICLLYVYIQRKVDESMFNCIEFFYVFSEYFKINEKTLHNALPENIQAKLLNELNKRMNIFEDGEVGSMYE